MNGDPIVVVGQKINWGGGDGTMGGGSTFFQQESNETGAEPHPTLQPGGGGGVYPTPSEPTDQDPPQVAAEVTDPNNRNGVIAAATILTNKIAELTPRIAALPDNAQITLRDGSVMTGAQVKEWWGKANFLVTDRNNFGTDRGGGVIGPLAQMNFNTVLGYDAWGNGAIHIMIHDIMHMTDQGRAFDNQQWLAHLASGGTHATYDGDNALFQDNEAFVNFAAREVLAAIGAPPLQTDMTAPQMRDWMPPYGY